MLQLSPLLDRFDIAGLVTGSDGRFRNFYTRFDSI